MSKISEPLIHELLETTKMYIGIPFNAIFMFVAYEQYKTLHFFEKMIYNQMLGKCGPKVSGLLRDIYVELENTQQD